MNKAKIIFLCRSYNVPKGGVKQIYRQVDVLNNLGYEAYVMHQYHNQTETWFENQTAIIYNEKIFNKLNENGVSLSLKGRLYYFLKHLKSKFDILFKNKGNYKISSTDILVLPEIYAHVLGEIFPKNPKVVYVQECFLLYYRKTTNSIYQLFNDKKLLGAIVNSQYGKHYINTFIPQVEVLKIKHSIDSDLFKPLEKKKKIALMSRKLPGDAHQLTCILNQSKFGKEWELCDINENYYQNSLQDVAKILGESKIFIHLASTEGFGLPGAEAMSAGCLVIGYAGYGGNDFMKEDNCFKVPERDITSLAKTMLSVLEVLDANFTAYDNKIFSAKEFINSTYNQSEETKTISNTWKNLMDKI